MQIFHCAKNLCFHTQENYFIEWLWFIIFPPQKRQNVLLLIWVAVTILSGSIIICDRRELNCCQNKATFDFCNIFSPILIFLSWVAWPNISFCSGWPCLETLVLVYLLLYPLSLPKMVWAMKFCEYTNLGALQLILFLWNFRSKQ